MPALAALVIALAGGLAARRRPGWLPVAASIAAAVGWLLVTHPLRAVLWPRSSSDYLVMPAFAMLAAVLLGVWTGTGAARGRWAMIAAVLFGSWWLAGLVGRLEFWRAWVVTALAAAALHWLGAGAPRRAAAAALTLWGGLVLAGAPMTLTAASLVLVAVAAGLTISGTVTSGAAFTGATVTSGAVPPVLLAFGIAAAALGTGRLLRGGTGLVALVCVAAIAAPGLMALVERGLGRRLGRAGPLIAPVLAAAGALGVAWVGARLLRR